ncbi:aldo/keto reductase [Chloroflexota bacterium]
MSNTEMKYKFLGNTGLRVSAICVGAMTYGLQISEVEGINVLKNAFDAGINFVDSAPGYPIASPGKSEEIIGKAIKGDRDSWVVATKVGLLTMGGSPGAGGGQKKPPDGSLSRRTIIKSVEGSLKRLQTDHIDLLYAHGFDANTPVEETMRAFDDMIRQGKVCYVGCSNFATWQLCKAREISAAHNLVQYVCIEPPYSLLARDIETELLPYCESEGVGVCTYNPLAGEMLTGKHEFGNPPAEGRFTLPAYGPGYLIEYWSEANFKAVDRLKQLAAERGVTLPQFALAWILNNPTVTSVLNGFTTLDQIKENTASLDIELTPEEFQACDEVWAMFRPLRKDYTRAGPPPGLNMAQIMGTPPEK